MKRSTGSAVGKTLAACLLLIVGGSGLRVVVPPAHSFEWIPWDVFLQGRYVVPVGDVAVSDVAAEQAVLDFVKGGALGKAAAEAESKFFRGDPERDAAPPEYYATLEYRTLNAHLKLCRRTAETEAGLTAVLLLGGSARGWSERTVAPIIVALKTLGQRFPGTWQATIAPLLEAALSQRLQDDSITDPANAARRLQKTEQAITFLREKLPSRDVQLDPTKPQIRAFLESNPYIQLPARAAYLGSIAAAQYDLGWQTWFGADVNRKYLEAAEQTGSQIIDEYPDSSQAKWARNLVEREIPYQRMKAPRGPAASSRGFETQTP